MTKEEIIHMAREAGFESHDISLNFPKELERFAALVAAAAKSEENEACAKLLESRRSGANELMDATREMEAYAIRARGQK